MDPKKLITDNVRPCVICHALFEENLLIPLGVLREDLHKKIQGDCETVCHPENHICRIDLSRYSPYAEINCENDTCRIFSDATEINSVCTFKDHCADILTLCMGSWSFLIWSCVIIGGWVLLNTNFPMLGKFDPYPFIFLNLVLSMISAVQAPVILMSQNRLSEIDRIRATYDYGINLKAEMEIRQIQEKLDSLLLNNPIHRQKQGKPLKPSKRNPPETPLRK